MGFTDRMAQRSEQVYQRIESGQCTDVEAELMDAQLEASTDHNTDQR